MSDWSRKNEELGALRRAVHNASSTTVEKQEHWRRIADLVGTRGKREVSEKPFGWAPSPSEVNRRSHQGGHREVWDTRF